MEDARGIVRALHPHRARSRAPGIAAVGGAALRWLKTVARAYPASVASSSPSSRPSCRSVSRTTGSRARRMSPSSILMAMPRTFGYRALGFAPSNCTPSAPTFEMICPRAARIRSVSNRLLVPPTISGCSIIALKGLGGGAIPGAGFDLAEAGDDLAIGVNGGNEAAMERFDYRAARHFDERRARYRSRY